MTPALASEFPARLVSLFEAHRDPARAAAMSAYMRNLFPFLGIPTSLRRSITRDALTGLPRPNATELTAIAEGLWALAEREYQYAACDLLSRYQAVCTAAFLPEATRLITTKLWWDTVDGIASNVVGPLVSRHPDLAADMDRWIAGDNLWLARSALLYQLHYKGNTDSARLFRYCETRARESDFFLRKAIGWVLREYSKTDAHAVRQFVAEHADLLSPLSKREALLWLDGRHRSAAAREA